MIEDLVGKIHYVNATKTGQKIGVATPIKVIHFKASSDERFEVGDVVVLTLTRAPAVEMPDVAS